MSLSDSHSPRAIRRARHAASLPLSGSGPTPNPNAVYRIRLLTRFVPCNTASNASALHYRLAALPLPDSTHRKRYPHLQLGLHDASLAPQPHRTTPRPTRTHVSAFSPPLAPPLSSPTDHPDHPARTSRAAHAARTVPTPRTPRRHLRLPHPREEGQQPALAVTSSVWATGGSSH